MTRSMRFLSLLVLAPAFLGACSDADSPTGAVAAPTAARAFAHAGDGQHVTVGGLTTDTLTVFVVGTDGGPIADASVTWTGTDAGILTSAATRTDARGFASAIFAAGTRAGMAQIAATVAGLEPVVFTINMDPGAPSQLIAMAALHDTLAMGEGYTGGGVRVTDAFGNAVEGLRFDAALLDAADEALQVGMSTSDARGIVTVPFAFAASTAGDYTLRFSNEQLAMSYRITVLAPVDSTASALRLGRQ